MLNKLSLQSLVNSPLVWAVAGFVIGFLLGVTNVSAWLLTLGFVAFLLNLKRNGKVDPKSEGWLVAEGPLLMIGWVLGFFFRGILL